MRSFFRRSIYIFAAVICIILLHASVSARAALKPEPVEKKVILYTDSSPYTIRFINLSSDAKLKFTSTDAKVVKITDRQAVPVKAGKATVKVTVTQNNKNYKFKIKFTVKNVPKEKSAKNYKKLAAQTIEKLKSETLDKSNIILDIGGEIPNSTKKETDRYIYEKIITCRAFSLAVSSPEVLRSETEYLDMFPFISEFTFSEPIQYHNAFLVIVTVDKNIGAFYTEELELDYVLAGGKLSYVGKDAKQLYKKVTKAAEKLKKDSDFETIKAVHDHVIKKFTYDGSKSNNGRYKLISALKTGKTVCSGYAKYFYFLCKALGYEVDFVIGGASGEGSDHGWNLVKIGHKWYGVDVTWDDREDGSKFYKYFLISDEEMGKDHWWDESAYPKAVSKDLGVIYSNLEKYPVVNGEKEALEFLKDEAEKLAASNKSEKKLVFREMTTSKDVFGAINKELNTYGRKYGISWKDWETDAFAPPGWVYHITIFKK